MTTVTGEQLEALIPQKRPFVLISALTGVTENNCTSTFTVNAGHVLCDNGKLNISGLIENMAQTCAAKVGYENSLIGKGVPIGFIGDVKDFTYSALPQVGEQIETEINIITKIFDVTIIDGKIKLNGREIASGRMKIYTKE